MAPDSFEVHIGHQILLRVYKVKVGVLVRSGICYVKKQDTLFEAI